MNDTTRDRTRSVIPVTDARELIDSAQDCARRMAECCAAKDAEIRRLREAICEYNDASKSWAAVRNDDTQARKVLAIEALRKIAREEG